MRLLPLVIGGVVLSLGCGSSAGGPAAAPSTPALSPKEVGENAAKYKGQKVKVTGVYVQGFSNGGRDGDPWALVIGDAPAVQPTVACLIPKKIDIPGRYPKITAEGTVSDDGRVVLTGCTYKLE